MLYRVRLDASIICRPDLVVVNTRECGIGVLLLEVLFWAFPTSGGRNEAKSLYLVIDP